MILSYFLFGCSSSEVYSFTHKPLWLISEDPEEQVEVTPPAPLLTSSRVTELINTALSVGVVEPISARDTFLWLRYQGDLECPGDSPVQLMGMIEPCVSESGYTYSGLTILRGTSGPISFPDTFNFVADCYIIDPNGNRFVGAGELDYTSWGSIDSGAVALKTEGTWTYPPEEGWVGTDNSIWLDVIISWTNNTTEWYINLDGATTIDERVVYYDSLYLTNDCHGGWGQIQLRDPSGYWYTLKLSDDCSGCGQVYYNDEPLGESCTEISQTGLEYWDRFSPLMRANQ